jgi:predicted nucleic acid-binding protein
MKPKETVYLDTSVPSAYFDERMPDRQKSTKLFWEKLENYDVCVSDVTISELKQTINPVKKQKLLDLVNNFRVLPRTTESDELAVRYIEEEIIPENYLPDAYHSAIATVNNIEYLVSWNFEHLVNVKTRRSVSLVNLKEGYKPIEIVSPLEL